MTLFVWISKIPGTKGHLCSLASVAVRKSTGRNGFSLNTSSRIVLKRRNLIKIFSQIWQNSYLKSSGFLSFMRFFKYLIERSFPSIVWLHWHLKEFVFYINLIRISLKYLINTLVLIMDMAYRVRIHQPDNKNTHNFFKNFASRLVKASLNKDWNLLAIEAILNLVHLFILNLTFLNQLDIIIIY